MGAGNTSSKGVFAGDFSREGDEHQPQRAELEQLECPRFRDHLNTAVHAELSTTIQHMLLDDVPADHQLKGNLPIGSSGSNNCKTSRSRAVSTSTRRGAVGLEPAVREPRLRQTAPTARTSGWLAGAVLRPVRERSGAVAAHVFVFGQTLRELFRRLFPPKVTHSLCWLSNFWRKKASGHSVTSVFAGVWPEPQ